MHYFADQNKRSPTAPFLFLLQFLYQPWYLLTVGSVIARRKLLVIDKFDGMIKPAGSRPAAAAYSGSENKPPLLTIRLIT
jgi:hypothetical protein